MKDERLPRVMILVLLLGMTIAVPAVALRATPTPDLRVLEAKMAASIFATLTAVAATPMPDGGSANTPVPAAAPRYNDELVEFATALRELVRLNAAISSQFERWYSKVKNQNPSPSDISEYGSLLARRAGLVSNAQALPRNTATSENRDQWINAVTKRYDAETLYFRLLTENDPQSRRNLYAQFVSSAQEADQIYSQAADRLISELEFAAIDCAQVRMCANDFGQ